MPHQQTIRDTLLTTVPTLGLFDPLQEGLRAVWKVPTAQGAAQALSRWLLTAEPCDDADALVGARTVRRWHDPILKHWHTPARYPNGDI